MPGLQLCQVNFFLGLNKKSRIQETLNYLAYTDSSTDAKWLKTVDRKKGDPYQGPQLGLKCQVSLSILREEDITFQLSKLHFWGIFSQYTFDLFQLFFLLFFFFLTKKLSRKILNTLSIMKKQLSQLTDIFCVLILDHI